MSLLGYYWTREIALSCPGEASSVKAAISNAPKGKVGRGMDAGHIVLRLRRARVVIALFTRHNRSGYGPLFDGYFEDHKGGLVALRGRFRWMYLQMIIMGLVQLGVLNAVFQSLLSGAYHNLGLNALTASLLAGLVVLAIGLAPWLGWKTRECKTVAVMEFLTSCGFVVKDRESERAGQ
jgi:hypothetical protein